MARQPPKCCGCVPLRPGLLAWAYIKLVLAVTSVGAYFYNINRHPSPIFSIFEDFWALSAVCLPYLVFTIIFIIGVHRQNSKLLLVFLVYSIFEIIIAVGAVGWQVYVLIKDLSYHSKGDSETIDRNLYYRIHSPVLYLRLILPVVVDILLPIYIFMLIMSEVQRLMTAHGETRVVLDEPVTKEQGRRYYFVDETPDLIKPLFPVEVLKRLRQQLGVKNV